MPVILFTKGGGNWLEAMAETGCDALGLDWTVDIGEARRRDPVGYRDLEFPRAGARDLEPGPADDPS